MVLPKFFRRGSVICEPRGHDSSLLFGIASGLPYMDRAGETAPGGTGITLLAIDGNKQVRNSFTGSSNSCFNLN